MVGLLALSCRDPECTAAAATDTTRGGAEGLSVMFLADHLGYATDQFHGGTTYYLSVLPALARAGVAITFCIMGTRHAATHLLEDAGIRPIFLGHNRWDPRSLASVRRLIAQHRVRVLHLACLKAHFVGRLAAALAGCSTVVHLHDTFKLSRPMSLLQRSVAKLTDACVVVSEPVRRIALEDYGLPAERVEVLVNAIDVDRFRVDPARASLLMEFQLPPSSRLIGIIGRLASMKGQAYAIRAMPEILRRCPAAVLMLCGDGAQRGDYERLVATLGIGHAVRFMGQRSDVPEVLAALDLVALPSMFGEGLPFSALEALAAGRPLVAFPVGGIPAAVCHGRTGLLVAKGDICGLATAICDLLEDPELLTRMGLAASAHAKAHFGLDAHIRRLIEIYLTSMKGKRSERGSSRLTTWPLAKDQR